WCGFDAHTESLAARTLATGLGHRLPGGRPASALRAATAGNRLQPSRVSASSAAACAATITGRTGRALRHEQCHGQAQIAASRYAFSAFTGSGAPARQPVLSAHIGLEQRAAGAVSSI